MSDIDEDGGIETEIAEKTVIDTARTAGGDLARWLIDQLKFNRKPWDQMLEFEQRDLTEKARWTAQDVVAQAVRAIAADGRTTVVGKLLKVEYAEKEIKGTISMPRDSKMRHALVDAQGQQIMLVITSISDYLAGEYPKAEPDQREMPVTVEGGEGAAEGAAAGDWSGVQAAIQAGVDPGAEQPADDEPASIDQLKAAADQGQAAHEASESLDACPFREGSDEWAAWETAWKAADAAAAHAIRRDERRSRRKAAVG